VSGDLYPDCMLRLAEAGAETTHLDSPDASVTVDNPLCGDRVTIDLRCDADGRVTELAHAVRGCVLCRAATAVLADHAVGSGADEIDAIRARLRARLRDATPLPDDAEWQDLAVFEPVAGHRSRHECVLLPFEATLRALSEVRGSGGTAAP